MDKCMYCGREIDDGREVTVCDICGEKVWGKKMFNTIKQNMREANEKGDLCHSQPFIGISNDLENHRKIN